MTEHIICDGGPEFDVLVVELFKRQLELEKKLHVSLTISGEEHNELTILQNMTDQVPNGKWGELSSRATAELISEKVG